MTSSEGLKQKRRVVVVTSIYGGYDTLKSIPDQSCRFRAICFTDNPSLGASGWETVVRPYPRHDLHPRLLAKYFRMLSHREEDLIGYDVLIWVDASIQIRSPHFVSWCIAQLEGADIALFVHPDRSKVREEVEASTHSGKYVGEPLHQQIQWYVQQGFSDDVGLYATGCFIRSNSEKVHRLMEDWWIENIRFSFQDQISLPYVLWRQGLTPVKISKNIWGNEFFFVKHRKSRREALLTNLIRVREAFETLSRIGGSK